MPTINGCSPFNPVPDNTSTLGALLHRLNDVGRCMQRAITGVFVETNLKKSMDIAGPPMDFGKELAERNFKQIFMKLFVGKTAIEDFAEYASWYQQTVNDKSRWSNYKTDDVLTKARSQHGLCSCQD